MSAPRLLLPAACAALALTGCNHTPAPATLDAIDWRARQPVYLIVSQEEEAERRAEALANATTREALKTLVSVDDSAKDLAAILDFLEQASGVNFAVNWPALDFSEIEWSTPVDLELADVTCERVLLLAMEQANKAAYDDERAGYEIIDGIVHITTLADLQSRIETRLYDISELVMDYLVLAEALYADQEHARDVVRMLREADVLADYAVAPFDLRLSSQAGGDVGGNGGGGGGGGGDHTNSGGGLFGNDDDPNSPEETMTEAQLQRLMRVENLMELIQDSVGDPDAWLDEEFMIREVNAGLLIGTTAENHEAIHALLAGMRESRARHCRRQLMLIETAVLLKRAEDHRLSQDYAAALSAIDQALRVDPQSPEAIAMREVVVATIERGQ